MTDLVPIKQMLVKHEGVRTKPYRDTVGKLTIGVGRNLDDVGVSKDEIDLMLTNDIISAMNDLDAHILWWRTLSPNRAMVLIDMCFEMGIGGLLGFPVFLNQLKLGQYPEAKAAMLDSEWARVQSPNRANEDAELILNG